MKKNLLSRIPNQFILPLFVVAGIIVGLGGYTLYMSKAHSYLSDDPAACVNCHIMEAAYQSWDHSSHAQWTNCNDCHVPQDNFISKYAFKAMDGLYHAAAFTVNAQPQSPRPRESSYNVIMDNCIRCHTQLNTAFVETGMISYTEAKEGKGKTCWDCHRDLPHTQISGLASSPHAITPIPKPSTYGETTIVPAWLSKQLQNKK